MEVGVHTPTIVQKNTHRGYSMVFAKRHNVLD